VSKHPDCCSYCGESIDQFIVTDEDVTYCIACFDLLEYHGLYQTCGDTTDGENKEEQSTM